MYAKQMLKVSLLVCSLGMVCPNLIELFSTARSSSTFLAMFIVILLGIQDDG